MARRQIQPACGQHGPTETIIVSDQGSQIGEDPNQIGITDVCFPRHRILPGADRRPGANEISIQAQGGFKRLRRLRREYAIAQEGRGRGWNSRAGLSKKPPDDRDAERPIGAVADWGLVEHECPVQLLKAITSGTPKSDAQDAALAIWIATMLVSPVHQPFPNATTMSGENSIDCRTGHTINCS